MVNIGVMNVFYHADVSGNTIRLDPGESTHCLRVLRLKIGDQVKVVDGKGGVYDAEISGTEGKQCTLSILSSVRDFEPMGYALHMGIAPTKNQDRFEWFVEKATEIGITSITPLICEHSERTRIRKDRLERIIISAMKQSVRAYKPVINDTAAFSDWIADSNQGGMDLIAYCEDDAKQHIWQLPPSSKIRMAIGPEGDFSPGEISQAIAAGLKGISLGKYRLRTETAGIFACTAIAINQGR